LYGWWASWTTFWVILVGGGGFAGISFIVWLVRLVDQAETAEATDGYVDIYDMQTFMVRVALGVNIGFTVATILLIAAAVTSSLLMFRVTAWQQSQADARFPSPSTSAGLQEQPFTPAAGPQPGYRPGQQASYRPPQQAGYRSGQGSGYQPAPLGGPGLPMPSDQLGRSAPQSSQQSGHVPLGQQRYAARPLPGFTTQPNPRFPSYGSKQQQSGDPDQPSN
jgi:hypothetical protein